MYDNALPETSPWHAGEIALQRSAGVADKLAAIGNRVVRNRLIDQHRAFFSALPFVVAGAVDREGDVWATVVSGRPGFLSAPDDATLAIAAPRDLEDPADAGFDDGAAIGLLGIELHTRRRNRLNGAIRRTGDADFAVEVSESFGNCPKYIRLRDYEFVGDPATAPAVRLDGLDALARALIVGADTMFVASYVDRDDGGRQVDVSHRGGRPGFVDVGADGALTIPDFAGNSFFNTLGNVLANPRAGLLFVDFATGDTLQITGAARLVLDGPEVAAFEGAERLLRVTPTAIVRRERALPIRWRDRPDGASPYALATGAWGEAKDRLRTKVASGA